MLSVLLFAPLVVGLICLALPPKATGWFSFAGSLIALGLSIALICGFDSGDPGLQYVTDHSWIPELGVRYSLGVDGISLFLILMTTLLWSAALAFASWRMPERPRNFFFMLGLGETAALGAFLAQDLLLFVLFFDLMLIPFFFLIGTYGRGNRVRATIKMMIYTLAGSLLMLVGAIATAVLSADQIGHLTFSIAELRANLLPAGSQEWIFLFFAAAFLVKMPTVPLHGWMPDAYRSAPLSVVALLSGVLPKVAAFGFLRIVLPIFPAATVHFQELILVFALGSVLYGSVMAFTQTDLRLIAGYSSIAQLGFIILGIFSLRSDGSDGAVLQMFNHGIVVVAVFFVIGILAERFGTDDLREMGGMAQRAPYLAALFMIITLALLAMPGSANFIGEFYILNGLFQAKIAFAVVAGSGVALAAFYALRMYQRSMHNRLPPGKASREIGWRDGLVLTPLVVVILAIAVYPNIVLSRGEASVQDKIGAVAAANPDQSQLEASR